MKIINYPAVRALRQALNRSERLAAQERGAEANRMFDGGEWSDADNARALDSIHGDITASVAERFGMTPAALEYAAQAAAALEYAAQAASHEELFSAERARGSGNQ